MTGAELAAAVRRALRAWAEVRRREGTGRAAVKALGALRHDGLAGLRRRLSPAPPAPRLAPGADTGACLIVAAPQDADLAGAMAGLLAEAGYRVDRAASAQDAAAFAACFVVGSQAFPALPPGCIVVETGAASPGLLEPARLRSARAVCDPSPERLAALAALGLPLERLFHLPVKGDGFADRFRRLLLGLGMLSLDAFAAASPCFPVPLAADRPGIHPRLCLGLPETPGRRAQFLAQPDHGFVVWDGLKRAPGWIGAGLSYKHLAQRLLAAGSDRALVCEDDVVFPPDFDRRLAAVERYLDGCDWNLFSGFMADADPRLTVSRVVCRDGMTFAHVDRAVSMVFNIYRPEALRRLAAWDEADDDVQSNTIDRHLERRPLKVVVALPFLAGHRDDATSTAWGFGNARYRRLSQRSEALLRRKVAAFVAARDGG